MLKRKLAITAIAALSALAFSQLASAEQDYNDPSWTSRGVERTVDTRPAPAKPTAATFAGWDYGDPSWTTRGVERPVEAKSARAASKAAPVVQPISGGISADDAFYYRQWGGVAPL